jgi:2-dehydropantoate 2-reductase
MAIERVCVAGAGTIGSLFAAHLARVADVSVLVRRADHARALKRRGLRVSGKGNFTAELSAADDPRAIESPDLVIIACKATQLEAVAASLEGRFPGATVMTVQNGLGAEDVVARHGDWPLISGVTFMSGVRHADAHVEYELDTATWIGPWAATETPYALVQEVHDLIVAGGLKCEAFEDLRPAQWSKLIFNSAVNGVAALTGLPHVRAFAEREQDTDLGHLVHDLMAEGKAVAKAAGVLLHEDPWEMNVRAVRKGETAAAAGHYAHMPSMLEDVMHHRLTEVDFIAGALVRQAGEHGVAAPLNAAIWRLVHGMESSWRLREPAPETAGVSA